MKDDSISFTFTVEPMLSPPPMTWLRRMWRRLRGKPLPAPVQPPGTVPLVLDFTEGTLQRRVYIPAARIIKEDQ